MVAALREISTPLPAKAAEAKSSSLPSITATPPMVDVRETLPGGVKSISVESLQSADAEQKVIPGGSTTETDEDEGMVLVGRP
jgi:hypothetical protein